MPVWRRRYCLVLYGIFLGCSKLASGIPEIRNPTVGVSGQSRENGGKNGDTRGRPIKKAFLVQKEGISKREIADFFTVRGLLQAGLVQNPPIIFPARHASLKFNLS